jgi:hypothetical protein
VLPHVLERVHLLLHCAEVVLAGALDAHGVEQRQRITLADEEEHAVLRMTRQKRVAHGDGSRAQEAHAGVDADRDVGRLVARRALVQRRIAGVAVDERLGEATRRIVVAARV